jgi:isopentenyl-diphosphate delta-isomerase
MVKDIVIIKFGGSVITDKSIPFSIKKEVISNLTNQIARYYHEQSNPIIIVHGGGSFGHPLARQYMISKGYKPDIPDQIIGLTKTHHAMEQLNQIIRDSLVTQSLPVLSFPPVDSFSRENFENIVFSSQKSLLSALELKIIPIFYGDIVFDQSNTFGILSGDQIIQFLCKNVPNLSKDHYRIGKVIFCFDKDGILKFDSNKQVLVIKTITVQEFSSIPVINSEGQIDVTGSLVGKLDEIKKIVEFGIPITLLNGHAPDRLFQELNGKIPLGTRIVPQKYSESGDIIFQRKDDHIHFALKSQSQASNTTWLEYVQLVHQANPEMHFQSIDTQIPIFNKKISFPLIIGALTGGTPTSQKINKILAEAAENAHIGMMLGSQRIALEHPEVINTFRIARESAPTIPLIGNIGIAQVLEKEKKNKLSDLISHIDADAIAIHLNPLQEVLQHEGEPNFEGSIDAVADFVRNSPIPIMIKETGAGLSKECVDRFYNVGIRYFDTAGLGGTNFAAIEMMRNEECFEKTTNNFLPDKDNYKKWGIPTAASILECDWILKQKAELSTLIGSGGVRTGLDMVKCCTLGATCTSIAQPFLMHAMNDQSAVINYIARLHSEFKKYMFLLGVGNVEKLHTIPYILHNPLKEWIQSRKKE